MLDSMGQLLLFDSVIANQPIRVNNENQTYVEIEEKRSHEMGRRIVTVVGDEAYLLLSIEPH